MTSATGPGNVSSTMDRRIQLTTEEAPRKRVRSDGCTVCGCNRRADKCDPRTGSWYCWMCFHDARHDLSAVVEQQTSSDVPPCVPRCFVCFSTDGDVTESACAVLKSPACGAVRMCAACRGMHETARCFSCWGVSGSCYKCEEFQPLCFSANDTYESRLCLRCAKESFKLRCYFCKRPDITVDWRPCSSCEHGSNLVCSTCMPRLPRRRRLRWRLRGKQPPPRERPPSRDIAKLRELLPRSSNETFCRSCFAQHSNCRYYRCRNEWARRSPSHFCVKWYEKMFPGAVFY